MTVGVEHFSIVCAVSKPEVAANQLLASPELAPYGCSDESYVPAVHLVLGVDSAASAFNPVAAIHAQTPWLIWIHQDVYLPAGWLKGFAHGLERALDRWPKLAVAGVYGFSDTISAGTVIDRGSLLRGDCELPKLVRSLDEMLFAVRLDAGLELDPNLKWDFYATDLVLRCNQLGWDAAVVDATQLGAQPCEHWSSTPNQGINDHLAQRIRLSGRSFLIKHQGIIERMGGIRTPIVHMAKEHDLEAAISACQSLPEPTAPTSPQRPKSIVQQHQVDSLREFCWLPAAESLSKASPETVNGLRRFYRCSKPKRIWHLIGIPKGYTGDKALVRSSLSSDWLVCLSHREVLITESFRTKWLRGAFDDVDHAVCWNAIDATCTAIAVALSNDDRATTNDSFFPVPSYATGAGLETYATRIRLWQMQVTAEKFYDKVDELCSHGGLQSIENWSDMYCEAQGEQPAFRIYRFGAGKPLQRATLYPWAHSYRNYHRSDRGDLLQWVPKGVNTILDWGGGEGGFLELIKKNRESLTAVLAEVNPHCLRIGQEKGFHVVDTSQPQELTEYRASIDLVTILDSFEHHSDPFELLRAVRCLLKPKGLLLLSVPHIGFWPVLWDLLSGRFEYEAVGPLCETHVRFFSKEGLIRLLDQSHFKIIKWETLQSEPPACERPLFSTGSKVNSEEPIKPEDAPFKWERFNVLAQRQA